MVARQNTPVSASHPSQAPRVTPRRRPLARLAVAAALSAAPAALAALAAPGACFGQTADTAPPEVEKSAFRFEGQLVSPSYVRSGPGTNFYPTLHLEKGATVVVVGKKKDWLVIQPPEGSFSFVQKQYVDKYGSGAQGKVRAPNQIVRAGSTVQPQQQWAVQTRLEVGQDVTILGDENEYFKIKPPESAYLYISANDVTAVRRLTKTGEPPAEPSPRVAPPPPDAGTGTDIGTGAGTGPGRTEVGRADAPRPDGGAAAAPRPGDEERPLAPPARPTDVAVAPAPATAPSSRPAVSEATARLQKLEADFTAASVRPLPDQPIDVLLAGYESLASAPGVPEPTRKMAGARAATLKVRQQVREQYLAVQKQQEEERQKGRARIAEQEELQERIRRLDMHVYTAVGTLSPSSLQVGNGQGHSTLYRLTDPATGRTVVYLRTSDPKYADLLGQFVGVKGEVGTEPQLNLKVIAPTLAEAVDVAKVNGNVAAAIIPPSLQGKTPTASAAVVP